jgi:adenine-specific DNA-methyltransferase
MTFEINRTELVWPGKYDSEGNLNVSTPVALPFQVVERVNETRATREVRENSMATLFDIWNADEEGLSFQDGWRNKLIWGDNKLVTESLLENYSNKIDLIYIDPPFAVGSDFSLVVPVGDEQVTKESSIIEEVAYRDTWGKGEESYLSMIYSRLRLFRSLLSENGSIYIHLDWRLSAQIRILCDEIFGVENFQREIIWKMSAASGFKTMVENFVRGHDTILFYSKSKNKTFNRQFREYDNDQLRRFTKKDEDGRLYKPITKTRRIYLDESQGVPIPDVWDDIANFQTVVNSTEILGYPTQKPEALLRRIIEASSNKGDLVADFFCGSGTTLAVAEKLGRRWIGSDLGRFAIHTTRKRLLEIADCKEFEILNLGNYERQLWSDVFFGQDLDGDGRISLLEYVAFILKLYGATAISGGLQLHGKQNNAFVHVGSVASPVTIQEIEDSVNECAEMKGSELHVLGWEWEMGLIDTLTSFAKSKGVKLLALQIPREVMETEAARKGQIKFFELSYLETSIERTKEDGEFVCVLEDFVIPNPELVPEEVRDKIKAWSDYVDYWAVDWDFQNDTFMPKWMDYRTKQDRSIDLKSGKHKFDKPGMYKVMIKVVDIFGNDTTKILELTVK